MAATAASRFACKPLKFHQIPSSSPTTTTDRWSLKFKRMAVIAGRHRIPRNNEKKATVVTKALVSEIIISEPQRKVEVDLVSFATHVAEVALKIFRPAIKRKSWQLKAEMFIERVIMDSQIFTLIAVAGSLLGSFLCFVEGSFHILQTYFHYFHNMSQRSDQGQTVRLLIEAIDMYVVGTAMLFIGMGLYVMFVSSKDMKSESGWLIPGSNLFGLFPLNGPPAWMEMQSVSQAKLKIGQSVVMILQTGLLEKFKNVPMATGLDLLCFAGTVLLSSACVFFLSTLSVEGRKCEDR
ncbi:uncharacterized protein LOC131229662 [Magnolia sinica]|uniref:uncharacterized protein LOC131229662 n=1 Tax=Magnolia sinica TaxID=86752 RepID=UPI002659CB0D|nr:uncharacterized protein LOC131229662 [Magnolia sinica]